ncbi:hypothetical protein PS874_01540 [Pseudomonas fluorescens]|nr:hypothetical protein PS874_01540 [Pseudomonas fluorescens]
MLGLPDSAARAVIHQHGITHFCLDVKDIDRVYQRLLAAGLHFHGPPKDFGEVRAT